MALTQVTGPYPIFTDLDGTPLDDGYLFIGAANDDPETNPIQVFWDSNLTIPATQPIRTNNGYAWRNGTPGLLYTGGEFSITIRNKRNEFVLYSPVGYGFDPAAVSASVVKNDFIGDGVTVNYTLSASPSTQLATNIFINGVYQEKDSYSLTGNVITFTVAPPLSSSIEILTNETGVINSGNATAISYTLTAPGAVQQTVQTKLEQYVSVKDFGASSSNTELQNKAALQAAISALDAQAGGTITVPSDINYGYIVTDKTTWPDFSGVTKPIIVEDASIGDSYGTYPTTYDGCQVRTFMFTPQTSPTAGLHDGNTLWLRADWAPNYCISNDADLSGARTADDNRRASYTMFNEGEATWRVGQGTISSAMLTSEELSNFIIEKYAATGDTLGAYNTMLVERKTGNVGFGLSTNAPGDSYVFKSVSPGFYQGVFEALTNTSYVMLRTSAGISEDAGIRNVAGDLSLFIPGQGDALTVNNADRRVNINQSLVQKRVSQTYNSSMALNTAFGNWFTIVVTDGVPISMDAPVNVSDGQQITVTFYNASGGSMGAVTWDSVFRLSSWSNPANGFNRSITFAYDGGNWIEISRTPADVPN